VILQTDFKEVGSFLKIISLTAFFSKTYNAFGSLEILEKSVLVVAEDLHSFV